MAIATATYNFNNVTIQHSDFCFKPISGKGCLVTSVMQYWQTNLTRLENDPDIKETSKCIPPDNAKERVCFDQIGVPVMPYTILGKQDCVEPKTDECSACGLKAGAL
jgi:Niemann-Pick C1 protein